MHTKFPSLSFREKQKSYIKQIFIRQIAEFQKSTVHTVVH